jgi:phage terminase Nu1 subunit (DNA packaging protein)
MQQDPTTGVRGAKPRLPRLKPAKEEIPKLSREYLEIRNRQMRAKALTAEMEGAVRRGQLIERRLVECQATYLLTVMRQRILRLPADCARNWPA